MGYIGREIGEKLAVSMSQSLSKAQALFELLPLYFSRFGNVKTSDGKDRKEKKYSCC